MLWESYTAACRRMAVGALLADVVKASEEELPMLTGLTGVEDGAQALLAMGCSLVFVTMGRGGAFFMNQNASGHIPAYDVNTIDTTGAGDGFLGAALYRLRDTSLAEIRALEEAELADITRFANAAGSLVTTKKGGVPAMPALDEVERLVLQGKELI
jgi:fructokinase